jgi:hypothetical protein
MQGKLIIVAAACVAAVTGASVALGSAGGSERTITATSLGTGIALVDADHDGKPSVGDYEVGTSRYVDPESGKAIGHGSVVCTQINAAGTEYQCEGSTHLPGGDLTSAGLFSPLERSFSLAVTGGTGVYAGASGTVAVTWLAKDFSKSRTVFTIRG